MVVKWHSQINCDVGICYSLGSTFADVWPEFFLVYFCSFINNSSSNSSKHHCPDLHCLCHVMCRLHVSLCEDASITLFVRHFSWQAGRRPVSWALPLWPGPHCRIHSRQAQSDSLRQEDRQFPGRHIGICCGLFPMLSSCWSSTIILLSINGNRTVHRSYLPVRQHYQQATMYL